MLIFLCACQHTYVKPQQYENPIALIETDLGTMKIELYEDKAPNTVSNFIVLTEAGYYKNMIFHSVIKGLAVKGGCPNTKEDAKGPFGRGGPGYFIEDEIHPELRNNRRGMISMSNLSKKDTNGSQFLILFDKAPFLDDKSTVFARVIEGLEVLDLIEKAGQARENLPLKREISFSIKIVSKNNIEYKFNKK